MGVIQNVLQAKGNTVFSISPFATVYSALEIMVEKNVSALVVIDNDKLIGIFTERDYARKLILKGRFSKETPIGDIMTETLITVTPDSTIDNCLQLMTNKFIRHLPVIENGKLVGLVSIGDLVKFKIEEQKFIIENMQQYITGA